MSEPLHIHLGWTMFTLNVCVQISTYVRTFELVSGVEDSHVRRYGVKSTASYDVHTFFSCLAAVVQLHALQKLNTHTHTGVKVQSTMY